MEEKSRGTTKNIGWFGDLNIKGQDKGIRDIGLSDTYGQPKKLIIILTNDDYEYISLGENYIKKYDYDKNIISKDLDEYNIILETDYFPTIIESYNQNYNSDIGFFSLIKQIMRCDDINDRDIIVYCHISKINIDNMDKLYNLMKSRFEISIIQIIEDLKLVEEDSDEFKKSELRRIFSKLYDASIFTNDKYQCINNTKGFRKIYYNHISEVKRIMYTLLHSYYYDGHDSDKMCNKMIFDSYNKYYEELKKIPYLDENGNRNQEYIDFEDKYMCEAMTAHCANEDHHYYDWKNIHKSDLIDMIEAIVDIYVAKSQSLKDDEEINLNKFTEMLESRGVTKMLDEKIAHTLLYSDIDLCTIRRYNGCLMNGLKYNIYYEKDALNYIKEKNEKFYNMVLDRTYLFEDPIKFKINTAKITQDGLIKDLTGNILGKFVLYIREDDNKMIITCHYNTGEILQICTWIEY